MYLQDLKNISLLSPAIALIVSIILWIRFGWLIGIVAISISFSLFILLLLFNYILSILVEIKSELSELTKENEAEAPIKTYSYKDKV